MISSDLFAYDFDQHPLSPPAVNTHGSAIQLTRRIRSQVPKVLVSKAKPPSRPLMTATTRAALVLQVRVGNLSLRPGQGLAPGKLGRCGCATGPEAGVVIDEHTRSNVHSRYKGQRPLYHIPLSCP